MRRLVGAAARERVSWLHPSGSMDAGVEARDATGWADSAWVLHAMYEWDGAASDETYDQERRADVAAGRAERVVVNGVDLDEAAILTGVPLGYVNVPEAGWSRLRWAELAARQRYALGADMDWPPCHRWFPFASWPLRIQPPSEGSLDAASFEALIDVLLRYSRGEAAADCGAYFSPAATFDFDAPTVYVGACRDVGELVVELNMTPSNLWPADRSWLVYTDWDLQGTKVSGSRELIAALEADDRLETIRWERPDVAP